MKHVVVVGGGVIGLTTAWFLLDAGMAVTLVERHDAVGEGASKANGGQLSYRYVSPLADEGVPMKAVGWLMDRDGPLRFRPEADLRQWRWLLGFLANCRATVNRRTTARLLALGTLSRESFGRLHDAAGLPDIAWRQPGKLVVYRDPASFHRAVGKAEGLAVRHEHPMSPRQCFELEPALGDSFSELAGGIFTPSEAVADCHAFCNAIATALRSFPGFRGIVRADAQSFELERGRATAVRTDQGAVGGDEFVVAAGLQSRDLMRTVGCRLPIYPLKGYSLTAPVRPEHRAPTVSVTDFERKVLYARIGGSLRVAAMVDIVGENVTIGSERIASLMRIVRASFPRAADWEQAVTWAGLRPATPDGAPIIGPSGIDGLWLNVGHGALGFTFASGSARVLTDLLCGRDSPVPLGRLRAMA